MTKNANIIGLNDKKLNQELFDAAEITKGTDKDMEILKARERELISEHLQATRNARKVQMRF